MNRRVLVALWASVAFAAPAMAGNDSGWTGLYAGVHAGYGGGNVSLPVSGSVSSTTETYSLDGKAKATSSGFLGGAQVGYNYLLPSNWLIGLEADASLSDLTAGIGAAGSLGGTYSGTLNATVNSSMRWLGTVRGRAGYVTGNGMLFYATGGFAYGGVRTSANIDLGSTGNGSLVHNTIGTGWTVGGGIETPIAERLTLRAEYLYANLGAVKVIDGPLTINTVSQTLTGTGSLKAETTANIIRVGLNYKLN